MGNASQPQIGRFEVAGATVDPMLNRLSAGDRKVTVEPKVMDLLVELARTPRQVRARSDLIDAVWGLNHGGDESLTKAVSGLRHALAELLPDEKPVETVAKRGYRLATSVTPLPAVGVEAAHTEVAPSARSGQRRAWLWPIAAVLLFTAGWFLVGMPGLGEDRSGDFSRIAIGPIKPAGDDPASLELARTLEAALLKELALGGIEVLPASQSERARLHLLGDFTRVDATSAVTLRIEDSSTGRILWTYQSAIGSRPIEQVREVVPWEVGNAVTCGLAGNDVGGTMRDPELLAYYITGCNDFRETGDFTRLLVNTQKALDHAPRSDTAILRNAISSAWMAMGTTSRPERQRLLADAQQAIEPLARAHPESGEVRYAHGVLLWRLEERPEAVSELREARRLARDYPYTINVLANLMAEMGYTNEAYDLRRRAVVADHFSLIQPKDLAIQSADRGDLATARAILEELAPLDPVGSCLTGLTVEHWWGDPDRALAMLDQPCVREVLSPAQRNCASAYLAFRKATLPAAAAFATCRDARVDNLLEYAGATGFVDEAFALAAQKGDAMIDTRKLFRSYMAPLRRDPRFLELAARQGLVEDWRAMGTMPDFCSAEQLDYSCDAIAR